MPLFLAITIQGNSRFFSETFCFEDQQLSSQISMPCAVRLAFLADERVKETCMACSFEIQIFSEECMFAQRQEEAKASLCDCDQNSAQLAKISSMWSQHG